jgi:P-type conjugative transfer protein TrbJ
VSVIASVMAWCSSQSAAQLTVFDPANFQQNLLSAARALEQINNQVRLLQNQALMIARMDQNLVRLGPTLSPDLQRTLSALQAQLTAGEGIALRLSATQSAYEQLFPKKASAALTHDDALRGAKARWDEAYGVPAGGSRAGPGRRRHRRRHQPSGGCHGPLEGCRGRPGSGAGRQ